MFYVELKIQINGALVSFQLSISFYELVNRETWKTEFEAGPSVEIYMLKIFMSLSPGLLIGLFLINNKVLNAWKKVWIRLLRSKPNASKKQYLRGPPLIEVSKSANQREFAIHLPHDCNNFVRVCPNHVPKNAMKKKQPSKSSSQQIKLPH